MDYQSAIKYMTCKKSLGIQPGLERIQKALRALGNPQDSYKTIHIAGTNGKGTVAATIADALTKSGYRTGLFTSPWVTSFCEQIQYNGKSIDESRFAALTEELMPILTDCTEFESLCVIAYQYFKEMKVDYAVIECGMGGKGDATNTEKENLCVITSIALDHTDFFGNSIHGIAEEKAGILRTNSTCVLSNEELKEHFEHKCQKLITGGISDNLSLVNAALKELDIKPAEGLVSLPARCERIGRVLLDGGHNVGAAKRLAPLLHEETAVIGMMKDKDVEGYLSLIAPHCNKIIATSPANERAMPADELAALAKKYCKNVAVVPTPDDAVKENGVTLVCGSFYLAREVRKILFSNI